MAEDVVIVGAGPYGLSLAAMLAERRVSHRIFGQPMRTWTDAMPAGMFLKSEGFASDLYAGQDGYTLEAFCGERGIPYAPRGWPVPLEVFAAYGQAFQRKKVPHLEPRDVVHVARSAGGYEVHLQDGQVCQARRVVVAAGISHFAHTPPALAGLPPELGGHAEHHPDPSCFAGQTLAVVGGGASATDYASLASQAGARVVLLVRAGSLRFLGPPTGRRRGLADQIRAPQSGLGPGWRSTLATDAPLVFHRMPAAFRVMVARKHLGPAGGWWTRTPIEQAVDVRTATTLLAAKPFGNGVALDLLHDSGRFSRTMADRVVAATGYQPELARLGFLSPELRALPTLAGAPVLSSRFESASPGLHFVGLSSVYAFGPLVRFAYGANFTGRHLTGFLAAQAARGVRGHRLAALAPAVAAPQMAGD